MSYPNNEINRFGSAAFANEEDVSRAGMFQRGPNSLFLGFVDGRPIFWNGPGGLLLTAGARSGKYRDLLAYNTCDGIYSGHLVVLDPKAEDEAVSGISALSKRYKYTWNPHALNGSRQDRCNVVEYVRADSPTLVSDVKVLCEGLISLSGSPQAVYFEKRARELMEAIILTLTRLDGVLTVPRLYRVINLIPGNTDEWREFAFEMHESGFEIAERVEEEIAASRGKESGGMTGILGELFKAVACYSEPRLMASVSPPYTFSLADLAAHDKRCVLHIMPPAEFINAWSPAIKMIFVGLRIFKSRNPSAPPQTWIIDEAAQLDKFPLIVEAFSIGAGLGIRPVAVFQSADQMKAIGPQADNVITASAACRVYFGIRDLSSATTLSRMLGAQTLEFDDMAAQARALHAKQQAMHALMEGGDFVQAGLDMVHHSQMANLRTKQQRWLRTPDEILTMPGDRALVFADGLPGAIEARRAPYYEQRFMAGRFLPNPYHPPSDRVRVKTAFGMKERRVITERVPESYAHLPQYRGGYWSYVEGFRP